MRIDWGSKIGSSDTARQAGRLLRDVIAPPRCLQCHTEVAGDGHLCATCWQGIAFIDGTACQQCGVPFPFDLGESALCAPCIAHSPSFTRARAAMRYDDESRALVTGMKFADRLEGAPAFGAWMARAGVDIIANAGCLVPVPLHRWRLISRRFNQAAELARALGRHCDMPVVYDALIRRKNTRPQVGLSADARRKNVATAFEVPRQSRQKLIGRNILLVDDVFTSGATADACARTLLRAGVASVDVITLARVIYGP